MRRSAGSNATVTSGAADDYAADPARCYTNSGESYRESLLVWTGPDWTENHQR